MKYLSTAILLILSISLSAQFHTLRLPKDSPKVVEQQSLGVTDIKVIYHSPSVQEREIWGKLVPYHSDVPWRGGANMNTIIQFSTDVMVEGQPLEAGSYGLHWKVNENGPWEAIFSRNDNVWGSYYYDESEDALRVQVTPERGSMREYLSYEFNNRKSDQVDVTLEWEYLKVPINIKVDVVATTLASIRYELRGNTTNAWESWNAAANFCLSNNVNLEEALAWSNRSISGGYGGYGGQTNFRTLFTKARILEALNRKEEANTTYKKAGDYLVEWSDYRNYANHMFKEGKEKEGIKLLEKNTEVNPNHYLAFRFLAIAYENAGMHNKALKAANRMMELTPPEYKAIFQDLVNRIQSKM